MISMNIICQVDTNNIIRNIISINRSNNNNKRFDFYINQPLESFINLDDSSTSGIISIEGTTANYHKFHNPLHNGYTVFITNSIYNLNIYESALDEVSEGVNVFDKKGYLLFSNKKAQEIEHSNRKITIGKHIQDIYQLDSEETQRFHCIKSKTPLYDYCDYYKTQYSDDYIVTLNSTVPIFVNNDMEAAVCVINSKENIEFTSKKLRKLEACKQSKSITINSQSINLYYTFSDIVGSNQAFTEAINLAKFVAERECSVLLHGETGTGKELFAQSIHSSSMRKNKHFVALNCAAIPETLAESILFGTEKGSFTGSMTKEGLLHEANGGTLFLDEINSMDITIQAKLLRVLQEKKFRKVGGLKDLDCDVRIISSTNEDPIEAMKKGKIRSDLYYRINTVKIDIPPLRERIDDIETLCEYFLGKYSCRGNRICYDIDPTVIEHFKKYSWPGNTRELLHAIEFAVTIAKENTITIDEMPAHIKNFQYLLSGSNDVDIQPSKVENAPPPIDLSRHASQTLEDIMAYYEKQVLENVLAQYNGNVTKSAEALGIQRQSMQYRMKKYDL
jgi:arginine utilization regulatory protein